MRCTILIVREGGNTILQTGTTHYNIQLGLSAKGRAIKGLVVYYVGSMGLVFGQAQSAWSGPLLLSG